MQVFGVWGDITNFSVLDSLIVALVAILLVFLVLTIIILVTSGIQKGMEAVAALVAVIDFHKETGKDAEIISIKKVED